MGRQQQALHCERCERTFSASEGASQYVDLTPLSGFEGRVYKESNWGGTTLFQCGHVAQLAPHAAHSRAVADCPPSPGLSTYTRAALGRTPLVSYIYERGWRQNFVWCARSASANEGAGIDRDVRFSLVMWCQVWLVWCARFAPANEGAGTETWVPSLRCDARFGFPGEEREFQMAMDHLQPAFGEVRPGSTQRRSPAWQPRQLTCFSGRATHRHLPCSLHTPGALLPWRFPLMDSTLRCDYTSSFCSSHLTTFLPLQVLVDMSCGSGLFARRFAASGCFKGVIASDFSAGMLDQTSGFIAQNAAVDPACALPTPMPWHERWECNFKSPQHMPRAMNCACTHHARTCCRRTSTWLYGTF